MAWASVIALLHLPLVGLLFRSLFRTLPEESWEWAQFDSSVLLIVCPMLALLIWRRPPFSTWNTSPSGDASLLAVGIVVALVALITGLTPLLTVSLPLCVQGRMRQWLTRSDADLWGTPIYLLVTLLPLGMIPQWEIWPSRIACHIAAWIGGALLQFGGYPVVVEGTIVYTRGNANYVLDSCSGLTIYGSILYLGIVAGTLWKLPMRVVLKRVAIIMPIAIVGNASRVTSVSAAYDALGHPTVLAHEAPSLITSLVCFALLFYWLKKDKHALAAAPT